jgi:hypothetical protein
MHKDGKGSTENGKIPRFQPVADKIVERKLNTLSPSNEIGDGDQ